MVKGFQPLPPPSTRIVEFTAQILHQNFTISTHTRSTPPPSYEVYRQPESAPLLSPTASSGVSSSTLASHSDMAKKKQTGRQKNPSAIQRLLPASSNPKPPPTLRRQPARSSQQSSSVRESKSSRSWLVTDSTPATLRPTGTACSARWRTSWTAATPSTGGSARRFATTFRPTARGSRGLWWIWTLTTTLRAHARRALRRRVRACGLCKDSRRQRYSLQRGARRAAHAHWVQRRCRRCCQRRGKQCQAAPAQRRQGKSGREFCRESPVAAKRMRNSSSRKRPGTGASNVNGSGATSDYTANDGSGGAEYLGKRRPTLYLALDEEEHYWSVRRSRRARLRRLRHWIPNLEGAFWNFQKYQSLNICIDMEKKKKKNESESFPDAAGHSARRWREESSSRQLTLFIFYIHSGWFQFVNSHITEWPTYIQHLRK